MITDATEHLEDRRSPAVEAPPPPAVMAVPPPTGGGAAHRRPRQGVAGTRAELVAATERLLRSLGYAGVTTRDIAREAGCSDGALYTHFGGKEDLVLECVHTCSPDFAGALGDLIERVGEGTVEDNLTGIAAAALSFHRDLAPILFAVGADAGLAARFRALKAATGAGPRRAHSAVAAYLAAEQRLGRVSTAIDPRMTAVALLGACQHAAVVGHLFGPEHSGGDDGALVSGIVRSLVLGAAPRPASAPDVGTPATRSGR